jgi:hypothetical protein
MNKSEIIFPPQVQIAAEEVSDGLLSSPLFKMDHPNTTRNILINGFGKAFFQLWLAGEDLVLEQEEASKILNRCIATSLFDEMLSDNMLDVIEDLEGTEHVFITQKGKDAVSILNKLI